MGGRGCIFVIGGRGMPRPYKALPPQGYERDFTAITEALRLSWKFEVGHFLLPTCSVSKGGYYGVGKHEPKRPVA